MPLEPLSGNHRSALYLPSRHSFSHENNQANSLLPYPLLSLVATPRIKMTRMCGEKIHRWRPSYGSYPPRWALATNQKRPATVSSLPLRSNTLLSSPPQVPSSGKCPQTPKLRTCLLVIDFILMLTETVKLTPSFEVRWNASVSSQEKIG